jgi:competence protein ComEC
MRRLGFAVLAVAILSIAVAARSKQKLLQIYFLDTEGGQATLVATPSGHGLLFDAGWAGGRDAARIVAAVKDAKVKHLDYLVVTHFHPDHAGGVPDLAQLIKVGTFVDHGPNLEDSDAARRVYAAYENVADKTRHLTVKPGDGLPLEDATVKVLTAAGTHIADPLAGAGTANSFCDLPATPPNDDGENSRSVGTLITFGKFRFLDMGDLSEKQELELACPNNMIGTIDLYLVTHHGAGGSNAKALVWGLAPRVAVMENGSDKGDDPATWQIIHDSPRLEDLWQLHLSAAGENPRHAAEPLIANLNEKSEGNYFKVSADQDGNFTVFNSRTKEAKSYHQRGNGTSPSSLPF